MTAPPKRPGEGTSLAPAVASSTSRIFGVRTLEFDTRRAAEALEAEKNGGGSAPAPLLTSIELPKPAQESEPKSSAWKPKATPPKEPVSSPIKIPIAMDLPDPLAPSSAPVMQAVLPKPKPTPKPMVDNAGFLDMILTQEFEEIKKSGKALPTPMPVLPKRKAETEEEFKTPGRFEAPKPKPIPEPASESIPLEIPIDIPPVVEVAKEPTPKPVASTPAKERVVAIETPKAAPPQPAKMRPSSDTASSAEFSQPKPTPRPLAQPAVQQRPTPPSGSSTRVAVSAAPARPMQKAPERVVAVPTPAAAAQKPAAPSRPAASPAPAAAPLHATQAKPTVSPAVPASAALAPKAAAVAPSPVVPKPATPPPPPSMKVDTFSFPKMSSAPAVPQPPKASAVPAPAPAVLAAAKQQVATTPPPPAPRRRPVPIKPGANIKKPSAPIPPAPVAAPAPMPLPPQAPVRPQSVAAPAAAPAPTAPPPPTAPVTTGEPQGASVTVAEEIARLEKDIAAIEHVRREIEGRMAKLFLERTTIEKELAPIMEAVRSAAKALDDAEAAERAAVAAGGEALRKAEEVRYARVEEKHAKDEARWAVQERLEAVLTKISAEESAYAEAGKRERAVYDRIHALEAEVERKKLSEELAKVTAERGSVESRLGELSRERSRIGVLLKELVAREATIESQAKAADSGDGGQHAVAQEKLIAEARYRLEKERHTIELERWKVEEALKHVHGSVEDSEKALAAIRARENMIATKLKQLGGGA